MPPAALGPVIHGRRDATVRTRERRVRLLGHPHVGEALVAGVQGALWALGGVPILLHEDNRDWVMRPDPAIEFWSQDVIKGTNHMHFDSSQPGFPDLSNPQGVDEEWQRLMGGRRPDLDHWGYLVPWVWGSFYLASRRPVPRPALWVQPGGTEFLYIVVKVPVQRSQQAADR